MPNHSFVLTAVRGRMRTFAAACLWLACHAATASAAVDPSRLARIDALIEQAVRDGHLPGAVVVVGHRGEVVYERAFGARSLAAEAPEPMTVDTVFDLASLTKVVATTTSVMMLIEEGRLRLRDRVADFVPGFAGQGRQAVTIAHLLTHTSGLAPDLPLDQVFEGAETAIARTIALPPAAGPGERFIYSDLNFMLLAEIVRHAGGQPLDRFAEERIFRPLSMADTAFNPRRRSRPGSRRPSRARPWRGPAAVPARPCCGGGCTTRPHGAWAVWPVTPGCSAPPATSRGSARCCSAAARTTASACWRRSAWPA